MTTPRQADRMSRAPVDGIELEYETHGGGEPVVLIHGGLCADWFTVLLDQRELSDRYRLIRYHRIGYAGSDSVDGPVSLHRQAAHCASLMQHLGIAQAHIAGHSSGANIALQLALDHPAVVRSLALLEPALPVVPPGTFAARAIQHYQAGDRAAAVDTWMRGVAGPDYRTVVDQALPGSLHQALIDADTFFEQELPAVRAWRFGHDEARRIEQPVLAVLGARSDDVTTTFHQRHTLLLSWLPNVEPFELPDATHLLHVHNPAGMATALAHFLLHLG